MIGNGERRQVNALAPVNNMRGASGMVSNSMIPEAWAKSCLTEIEAANLGPSDRARIAL